MLGVCVAALKSVCWLGARRYNPDGEIRSNTACHPGSSKARDLFENIEFERASATDWTFVVFAVSCCPAPRCTLITQTPMHVSRSTLTHGDTGHRQGELDTSDASTQWHDAHDSVYESRLQLRERKSLSMSVQ